MTPDPPDITDILKDQEERQLMAAWMLPNEGPLTDEQRRKAMANFTSYLRLHNITAADVAQQIGKPRATVIGELIKGVYREKSDDHIRKLNMWIEQHARARAASLTDRFVTTTRVAKAMLSIAQLTRENHTISLVYGPTGIGKSRCALAIAEKYVGAIYIRCQSEYRHPRGLTRALANALRIRAGKTGTREVDHQTKFERVLATLRDSNRLVIIDEAQKLTDASIELLRDIHDECSGLPIMLVAIKDLHDRIVKTADPDHGQLYSRVEITRPLTQGHDLSAGGTNAPLFTMDDIRALYNQPPVKLHTDAAAYLKDVANYLGYGSLRRCRMLVQNAARLVRKRLSLSDGDQVTIRADDLERIELRLRGELSEKEAAKRRRAAANPA